MQVGVFAKSFDGDHPATVLTASRDAGFSTVPLRRFDLE